MRARLIRSRCAGANDRSSAVRATPRAALADVVADEAIVIGRSGALLAGCAAMEDVEILLGSIRQVRRDHVAYGPVRCASKTIDLTSQAGLEGENDFAQSFAFDKVVGQLIERSIEIVIRANIAFVCADHDLAVETVVPVEGKIGPLADKEAIRATARDQFVSDLH